MQGKNDLIGLILNIIVIIAQLIVIYMFIDFLFGGSPDLVDLIGSMVVALVVNAFRVQNNLGSLNGRFEIFNQNVRDGFIKVKDDMNGLRNEVKENMKELKDDFRELGKEIKTEIRSLKR